MSERAIIFPNRWDLLSIEKQKEVLGRTHSPRPSAHLNETLSPVDLYCYLQSRFGEPNGLIMLQQEPSTANLVHWQYVLRAERDVLSIEGANRGVGFYIVSDSPVAPAEWAVFEQKIREDFRSQGQGMGQARQRLERWELFINPFQRNRRRAQELEAQLAALDLSEPDELPPVLSPEQHERFGIQFQRWVDSMGAAAGLALNLRMLAPVLAESFVNLCIFLLAKAEVRADERLLSSTIRAQIDVRVRRLHLDCAGFARPVDTRVAAFTDFHTLMNRRNDLYHGNVEPKKLRFDTVYLDGSIPLFADDQILPFRSIRAQLKHNEPEHAVAELRIVQEFIQHVVSALEPGAAEALAICMNESHLAWHSRTGNVASLFPTRVAFSYPVEDPENDSPS